MDTATEAMERGARAIGRIVWAAGIVSPEQPAIGIISDAPLRFKRQEILYEQHI